MDRFEVICFILAPDELLPAALTLVVELVAHCGWAYIEGKADCLGRVLHVATTLDDVFRRDIEGCWTIFLLKATREVALMVVLPFNYSTNLVNKFCR